MREQITKDNSEFYALLEKHNVKLTPNWEYSIENGTAYLYDKIGIVCFCEYAKDDTIWLTINSGTLDGSNFTKEMIKDIISAGDYYRNMIIQSTNKDIYKFMKRKGFVYNEKEQYYIRRRSIQWG